MQRALDGDSLVLTDGRQVRLLGINAPEFGKDGNPDQALASAARDRVAALTRGQVIRLQYDQERQDRHRRVLAYVFLPDGRDLQQLLLREGLAWYIAVVPNTAHLALYRAAEAQAREARRGVWNQAEHEPLPAEKMTVVHAGFRRVRGTITATRSGESGTELILSPSVRIFLATAVLRELGQTPQTLRGKRVLARGWFTAYKDRVRLRINHPAMVEELL